jgi:hypothetical protein
MNKDSTRLGRQRYSRGYWLRIAYTAARFGGFTAVLAAVSHVGLADTQQKQAKQAQTSADRSGWKSLLGKDLEGWTMTDFYRPGKVSRQGDVLVFDEGTPLTGITTERKDFPTENFEIELQARRVTGNDFLCGLTFPVGKGFCTFIAGGWGGGLVGLSSVDGADASENQTTGFHEFENGKWYQFKISVDDQLVRGWIDEKEVFSQEREGRKFSTRIEVFACQPLGLCAFQSKVEIKNFRWRPLPAQ